MDGPERQGAIDAFNRGDSDLLLATDAGAEGLNLQSRCRVVINLELPWNPNRLEQRFGRVDRLGQTRTVHGFHFLAEGTAESGVLAALMRRVDCIAASEIEMAACVIQGKTPPAMAARPTAESQGVTTRISDEAASEAARVCAVRGARSGLRDWRPGDRIAATALKRPRSIPRASAAWFIPGPCCARRPSG
jgi:superfamily II DNA/RNA helicase